MEQAPQVETIDRKELLEQQFEQSEETSVQERDGQGRFAEAQEQPVEAADEPLWRKAPASWKKSTTSIGQRLTPRCRNTHGSARNR